MIQQREAGGGAADGNQGTWRGGSTLTAANTVRRMKMVEEGGRVDRQVDSGGVGLWRWCRCEVACDGGDQQ